MTKGYSRLFWCWECWPFFFVHSRLLGGLGHTNRFFGLIRPSTALGVPSASSFLAFIITLGIVVDDAIVTGRMYSSMQRGSKPLTARSRARVATPVFRVITTMVAFYPLSLMSGRFGAFFSNIPLVYRSLVLPGRIEADSPGPPETLRTPRR